MDLNCHPAASGPLSYFLPSALASAGEELWKRLPGNKTVGTFTLNWIWKFILIWDETYDISIILRQWEKQAWLMYVVLWQIVVVFKSFNHKSRRLQLEWVVHRCWLHHIWRGVDEHCFEWWRHGMDIISTLLLLALYEGYFLSCHRFLLQRPSMCSVDVLIAPSLSKLLHKQWRRYSGFALQSLQ